MRLCQRQAHAGVDRTVLFLRRLYQPALRGETHCRPKTKANVPYWLGAGHLGRDGSNPLLGTP